LNLERVWEIAIIGAGDVGHALARYQGFLNRGFKVKHIFDADPEKIGKKVGGFEILDIERMEEVIKDTGILIAMLAVPASYAQSVTDKLVEVGIKAILNYAPIQINTPEGVRVQYLDPAIHLQKLTYYLT